MIQAPTSAPSVIPTPSPSQAPTTVPTAAPTQTAVTITPTKAPSAVPSMVPTSPTDAPTGRYGANATVLQPEMLMHTNSNTGPFLDESGDHMFNFSMFSGAPGATHARLARQANHRLRVVPQPPAAAPAALPAAGSFLIVSGDNVHVGAVKKEDGANRTGVIVRVADAEGVDGTSTLWVRGGAKSAAKTSIIELAPRTPLAVHEGNVTLPVGRWSIETLRIEVL